MDIKRRGFLGAILAAGVAPAFVGSSILMPVRKIVTRSDPRDAQWTADEIEELRAGDDRISRINTVGSLMPGDVITIAGAHQRSDPRLPLKQFRVTRVLGSGVIELGS